MTEQEKELLIKDLCARLPYNVCIRIEPDFGGIYTDTYTGRLQSVGYKLRAGKLSVMVYVDDRKYGEVNGFLNEVKPYLRSSLTYEEMKKIEELTGADGAGTRGVVYASSVYSDDVHLDYSVMREVTEYLLSRHFDVNGLIGKGLALEAPEGMYN